MSELTFEPFQKVLVRVNDDREWEINLFERMVNGQYLCLAGAYYQCLPYNNETKHLLGTTDSPMPPELEFKWGDHVVVRDKEDEEWYLGIFMDKHDGHFYAIVNKTAGSLPWKYCRHANW